MCRTSLGSKETPNGNAAELADPPKDTSQVLTRILLICKDVQHVCMARVCSL